MLVFGGYDSISYRNDMWESSLTKLIESDLDELNNRKHSADRLMDHCAWRFRGASDADWTQRCKAGNGTCAVDDVLLRAWCEQVFDVQEYQDYYVYSS